MGRLIHSEKSPLSFFYITVALFLLMTLLVGVVRILRGPEPVDRVMAAQLFGTTGLAILLLLAEAEQSPDLRNVALVFALLAVLTTVAFVKRAAPDKDPEEEVRQ